MHSGGGGGGGGGGDSNLLSLPASPLRVPVGAPAVALAPFALDGSADLDFSHDLDAPLLSPAAMACSSSSHVAARPRGALSPFVADATAPPEPNGARAFGGPDQPGGQQGSDPAAAAAAAALAQFERSALAEHAQVRTGCLGRMT